MDAWLRTFFEQLSCGLGVIFSRERLDHWPGVSPEWTSDTLIHIELRDLSARTSLQILQAAQVQERPIRKHIVRVANGHPLYLNVLMDTYRALKRAGRQPSVDDFGTTKKEVLARFVDHLDQRVSLCLKILSIPDEVDVDLFDFLSERFPHAFFGLSFSAVSQYSFFQHRSTGDIVMHTVMRTGLQSLTDERTRTRVNSAAVEFFNRKFTEGLAEDVERAYGFLLKAAAHRVRYDPVGFVTWLLQIEKKPAMGEAFIPFLESAS